MTKARLLVGDDHTLVLNGISKILESEFLLIGTTESGRVLVEQTDKLRPDLVILDISMPDLSGLDAAREIFKRNPQQRLMFLTMHGNPSFVREAMRTGATGYVLKTASATELVAAVRAVLNGETYVMPLVMQGSRKESKKNYYDLLTPRQREVLKLISQGCTSKEIATALDLSPRTAEFHRHAIICKLGLSTTAELTKYAIEAGISD